MNGILAKLSKMLTCHKGFVVETSKPTRQVWRTTCDLCDMCYLIKTENTGIWCLGSSETYGVLQRDVFCVWALEGKPIEWSKKHVWWCSGSLFVFLFFVFATQSAEKWNSWHRSADWRAVTRTADCQEKQTQMKGRSCTVWRGCHCLA